MEVAIQSKKYFLRHVFGEGRVANDRPCRSKNGAVMEGKRFVEAERSNRLSPDVVRHGLDQSSSLSVHQSPLSQQCKHRKLLACDTFVRSVRFAAFERCILVLKTVLLQR